MFQSLLHILWRNLKKYNRYNKMQLISSININAHTAAVPWREWLPYSMPSKIVLKYGCSMLYWFEEICSEWGMQFIILKICVPTNLTFWIRNSYLLACPLSDFVLYYCCQKIYRVPPLHTMNFIK